MTSTRNFLCAVATLLLITMPGLALAGGKGGGGGPTGGKSSENMTLNYGKVEHTYIQQSAPKKTGTTKSTATGQATGRRMYKPVRITTPVGQ